MAAPILGDEPPGRQPCGTKVPRATVESGCGLAPAGFKPALARVDQKFALIEVAGHPARFVNVVALGANDGGRRKRDDPESIDELPGVAPGGFRIADEHEDALPASVLKVGHRNALERSARQ